MKQNSNSRFVPRSRRFGFTLVELLVVIGIIALLVSVLMPALASARRQAQTIVCAANLRGILQAMQMYCAENKQFFPGPLTSGRHLFNADLTENFSTVSENNCPMVSQNWDWQAPLARYMNIQFNEGVNANSRRDRFDKLRTHPAMSCPTLIANGLIAGPYGPVAIVAGPPVSYALASQFHLLPAGTPNGVPGLTTGSTDMTSPPGYIPKITKVGDTGKKVYLADGCRWSTAAGVVDLTLEFRSIGGGAYGDRGPYTSDNKCWDRSGAPTNGAGAVDARAFAFRHGNGRPFGPADSYKFNVGFFDGHVETMGDLQGADPAMWMPKGSEWDTGGAFPPYNDVKTLYPGSGVRIIL